ncbi:MAG: MerR family transcriptional regulator [Bdellovibrionales bacterium]|nr:MerR family transcriptional regulator [Bdellovibrionales bacterium]
MAYFRIKEAADKVGVLPHVLRFWESQFPSLKPSKTSRGQRLYSDEDIDNFVRIRHLLYTEGYSIAGAKKALKEQKQKNVALDPVEATVEREFLKDLVVDIREIRDLVKEI